MIFTFMHLATIQSHF